MAGLIVLIVLIVLILIVAASCIKIVPQAHAMIIERFGNVSGNLGNRTSY